MSRPLQAYREAIAARVHAVCIDRSLATDGGPVCRIERFLPQLVAAGESAGPNNLAGFMAGVQDTVCARCAHQDAAGVCQRRRDAACRLYRYLLLVYDAIDEILQRGA